MVTLQTPPSNGTTDTPRYAQTVKDAAEALQARPWLPDLGNRLTAGMDLVLKHAVAPQGDGYQVTSGTTQYQLTPHCTCQFAEHQSKWCKHAIAVELYKAVQQPLGSDARNGQSPHADTTPPAADAPLSTPAASAPPPVTTLPEAPASITMKWQDGGVDLMLTLRDTDDDALFSRVKQVLPKIKQTVQQQAQAEQQQAEATGAACCPRHGIRKLKPSKFGGVYCTGKSQIDGTYCDYAVKA